MRSPLKAAIVLLMFAPVVALAQQSQAPTRQQVTQRLVELEKVGYNPYEMNWHYPITLQSAKAKAAQETALKSDAFGPSPMDAVEVGR